MLGGKGVYINVETLVEKGYLDKTVLNTLEKETGKTKNELKLLAANAIGTNESSECGTGLVSYNFSWNTNTTEPIYLCPYDGNYTVEVTESTLLNKILSDNKLKIKPSITKDSCEAGLFVDTDNDGATFFYRGDVKNNYIKYGKDQNGNDLMWRIVRINGDGSLRIILNENVQYSLLDIDNNEIPIDGINDEIHQIYPDNSAQVFNEYGSVFYNMETLSNDGRKYHAYEKVLSKDFYIFTISFDKSKNLNLTFNNSSIFENVSESTKLIYNKMIDYWAINILKIDDQIKENGSFCNNSYRYYKNDHYTDTFLPNENFKCDNNVKTPSITNSDFHYNSENIMEEKMIGHLSYGEYIMCENTINTCSLNHGYIHSSQPYILSNIYSFSDYGSGTADKLYYKFSDNTTKQTLYYFAQSYDYERARYYDDTFTKYYKTGEDYSYISLYPFRPVINLKSDIKLSGNGTESNPYIIVD